MIRTGIAEVMGSNPVGYLCNCLNFTSIFHQLLFYKNYYFEIFFSFSRQKTINLTSFSQIFFY